MSFKSLEYQSGVTSILKEALLQGRLPHAFLFAGPHGAGQRTTAMELAKQLFCQHKDSDGEVCEVCPDCRQIQKNSHPDFIVLEPQKDSTGIKIEEIRGLIAKSGLKPFSAPAKVFVIEPAESMNETAQNALLKTLEEPERGTYFILISYAPEQLIQTVRSRVQTLHFLPGADAAAEDPSQEKTKRFGLELVLRQISPELTAPAESDFAKLERAELSGVFDFLIEWFREVLLIRVDAASLLSMIPDIERKEKIAQRFSEEQISEMIELFAEYKKKVAGFLNVKLVWTVFKDRLAALV